MPLTRTNTNQTCADLHALGKATTSDLKNAPEKTTKQSSMALASAEIAASFNGSPAQKSLNRFLQVNYKYGQKPNNIQKTWMSIRILTNQMNTLEKANSEAGLTISSADYISSAREMSRMIERLAYNLPIKETQHPEFRNELKYHLGKMCEWNPFNRNVWVTASDLLQRPETITVNNEIYDKRACLAKASGITLMKYLP